MKSPANLDRSGTSGCSKTVGKLTSEEDQNRVVSHPFPLETWSSRFQKDQVLCVVNVHHRMRRSNGSLQLTIVTWANPLPRPSLRVKRQTHKSILLRALWKWALITKLCLALVDLTQARPCINSCSLIESGNGLGIRLGSMLRRKKYHENRLQRRSSQCL